jgi:ubiquinone/menaquinone biosynthesis methyltransferase
MFARIAPGYDRANTVMSFGIDRHWRRLAVAAAGESVAGDVLDLCAGTMDFSAMLAGRSRSVTAVDFCAEMLEAGRGKAPGAVTICADAREIPLADANFDLVIAGFGLRNVPEPERALREVRRVLRPGGVFVCVDFFRPATPLARLCDLTWNRTVLPWVGGLITGDASAYRYLADSMGAWTDRPGFEALCREAGFERTTGRELFPPIASLVVAHTPAAP